MVTRAEEIKVVTREVTKAVQVAEVGMIAEVVVAMTTKSIFLLAIMPVMIPAVVGTAPTWCKVADPLSWCYGTWLPR